jgi:hypothetical protein
MNIHGEFGAGLTISLALSLALLHPQPVQGQDSMEPRFFIEAGGGAALFGRFLEQEQGRFTPERELTASTSGVVRAALGVRPWAKSAVRLAFAWAPTEFEFESDAGLDLDDDFDEEDGLSDLNTYVLSLDVLRFLSDERTRFAPYATAGIAGVWWSMEEGDNGFGTGTGERVIVSPAGDDSQFRPGTVFGVGLQVRATQSLLLRLEANSYRLGNPLDGENAFRVTTGGRVIDEPDWVSMNRLTLGLAYVFGGR